MHIIKINNFLKILSHFFQNQRILIHRQDRFRKFRIRRRDKITLGKFDFEVGEKNTEFTAHSAGACFYRPRVKLENLRLFWGKNFPVLGLA